MKIDFICPTVPDHLNPMTALARHLQAQNHEVVFLYSSSANPLPFVPGDKDDNLNASQREISKLEGDGAIAQGVPHAAIPITFEQPGVATRIAAKFPPISSSRVTHKLNTELNRFLH